MLKKHTQIIFIFQNIRSSINIMQSINSKLEHPPGNPSSIWTLEDCLVQIDAILVG